MISIKRCLTIAVFIGLALGLIGALSGCASSNGGSMLEQHKKREVFEYADTD